MAGREAVASGCVLGQFAQPAPGCFGGICFGAGNFGPSAAEYLRSLATHSAAGCHRVCFAACIRADGSCGTFPK